MDAEQDNSAAEQAMSNSYLKTIAQRVCSNPSLHDDLIQEGRIAIWQLSEKMPDKPRGFYGTVAKRRMLDLLTGNKRLTGSLSRNGRDVADKYLMESLDAPVDKDGTTLYDVLTGQPEPKENSLSQQETILDIDSAISKLTPEQREYVINRFWAGKAVQELPRLWQQIKPKLAKELAHLSDTI